VVVASAVVRPVVRQPTSSGEPGWVLPSAVVVDSTERPGARAACRSSDSRRENWKRLSLYSSCVSVS